MVFCYQNCYDLLWEKVVRVVEKITRTIYSNSERSKQFLVKFGHSVKDKKFEKIFHLIFDLLSSVKFWVEDFFKGPGAKNDTSQNPGSFNQILSFESRKGSPVATF